MWYCVDKKKKACMTSFFICGNKFLNMIKLAHTKINMINYNMLVRI